MPHNRHNLHFYFFAILSQSRISFFIIQGIVAQLWIICNPSTIEINWIRLCTDFASSCRSHHNWWNCNDSQANMMMTVGICKKEAKSGRSSGAVPKMRWQSIHSDAMPQIKHNSHWLGQDWRIFAIKIQFGQIVSTLVDRLILNQIRHCLDCSKKAKSLTADKIAIAGDGYGKVLWNPVNCGGIADLTQT